MKAAPVRYAWLALGMTAATLAYVARDQFQAAYRFHFGSRVIVAVLDTGIDLRISALSTRLAVNSREVAGNGKDDDANGFVDDVAGWNFRDANSNVSDEDGHGTKMALLVAQGCEDCRILPVRITKGGAGVTQDDVAKALRYAVSQGAKVVNLSLGVTGGSEQLRLAVEDAASRGVVLVTAAGTGVNNPFRPDALATLYPQSYPHVVVVGSAASLEEPDSQMNFGSELDLVVVGQSPENFGSSYAAAAVSGVIARKAKAYPEYGVKEFRAMLRASATRPKQIAGGSRAATALSRIGSGAFNADAFHRETLRAAGWIYPTSDGSYVVEASGPWAMESTDARLECEGAKYATRVPAPPAADFSKGRAQFVVSPKMLEGTPPQENSPQKIPAGSRCKISVVAKFSGDHRVDEPTVEFNF